MIGGEARNFAFLGDGSFKAKPGFGVFLSVGGADGSAFKWPTWLPIRIDPIGIQWTDIAGPPGGLRADRCRRRHRRSRASRAWSSPARSRASRSTSASCSPAEFPIVGIDAIARLGQGQPVRRRAQRGADRRHPASSTRAARSSSRSTRPRRSPTGLLRRPRGRLHVRRHRRLLDPPRPVRARAR